MTTTARHENYVNPSNSGPNMVSISRVVPVYPKQVQPHERVLSLSNLDRQCPILMYLVLFYKPCEGLKDYLCVNDSVMRRLKSGLEETLSLWYPAAGRLRASQSDGKLNLWCNNEGAIMVEAHTHLTLQQLGDLSYYNQFFENLVYKPPFHPDFSNMPLVVAQVTKFGCGGYSIGIGTSHSLFDGPATYEFLSAWASNSETARGRRCGGDQVTLKPVHERGMLLTGNLPSPQGTASLNMPSSSSNLNLHNQQTKAVAIDHLHHLIMQAASEHQGFQFQFNNIGVGGSQQNNCVLKTFHVSGALIDYLRRKHFSVRNDSLPISTFEVLASHLWKARTKALGVRKEKKVCLQFAVDTRNKMMPPLPKGFSGNAYVLASVMMSAGEVERASYEGIVEKIREAKKGVNDAYVRTYVEALETGGGGAQGRLPPLKELTLVSDWTRMPFHDVGFFHAKAAYASPLASPIPQVAYFMQNPSHNGGVDVRIGLHPDAVSAFADYFLIKAQ